MTYLQLISKLERGENFSFSRFGDGELACAFGRKGYNCDGHEYFDDLGVELRSVLDDPKGIMGLQRYGGDMFRKELAAYDIPWADADILHRASIKGELGLFFDALTWRKVILVGAKHLKKLDVYDTFIEVPLKNAWLNFSDTLEEIRKIIEPDDVVLYACGMMAEVLIHKLYDDDFSQIDVGSLLDPYVGVNSRAYHKKLKI